MIEQLIILYLFFTVISALVGMVIMVHGVFNSKLPTCILQEDKRKDSAIEGAKELQNLIGKLPNKDHPIVLTLLFLVFFMTAITYELLFWWKTPIKTVKTLRDIIKEDYTKF